MADPSNDPVPVEDPRALDVVEEALGNVWAVANSLSRIRPARRTRFTVTLFGSARIRPGQPAYEEVKKLAFELAARGCDIVSGGGPGLMQAANEGAQLGDPSDLTRSIGIRIALAFEKQSNPFVDQVYTHQTFFTRLHHFVRLSDAFVVFGGGLGTLLELSMAWQLLQVRHIHDVPLILVGDMWRALVDWVRTCMLGSDPPYVSPADLDIPICVNNVDEALALLAPRITAHAERKG